MMQSAAHETPVYVLVSSLSWADPDPPPALRKIGQDWLERRSTAVLKVPSAVVIEEWNYLLNPQHPDFNKLVFGEPQPYQFDRRLARARRN